MKKKALLVLLVCLSAFVLAACASGGSSASSASSADAADSSASAASAEAATSEAAASEASAEPEASGELVNIRISAINAPTWSPVYVAKTQGFYEDEGVSVEFVTPGGPKGFQAMHAGDCEFSMLSQEPLLIAQEQGMESKIVAAMLKTRIYGFITAKDITDISQLKGETVYASDPGSAPYVFTMEVLKKGGLNPESDVTFVQSADQAAGIQAFLNGEVKGAFVNMSNLPMLGDFEYNVLVDTTDTAQSVEYLGSADFPGEMLCATAAYVENNPEVVQKVVNAVIKAEEWMDSHSDAEVAAALSSEFGDVDESILADEVAYIRKQLKTDGMISEEGQKAVVDMCIRAGIIKDEIPYNDVVDMSFAEAYAASK